MKKLNKKGKKILSGTFAIIAAAASLGSVFGVVSCSHAPKATVVNKTSSTTNSSNQNKPNYANNPVAWNALPFYQKVTALKTGQTLTVGQFLNAVESWATLTNSLNSNQTTYTWEGAPVNTQAAFAFAACILQGPQVLSPNDPTLLAIANRVNEITTTNAGYIAVNPFVQSQLTLIYDGISQLFSPTGVINTLAQSTNASMLSGSILNAKMTLSSNFNPSSLFGIVQPYTQSNFNNLNYYYGATVVPINNPAPNTNIALDFKYNALTLGLAFQLLAPFFQAGAKSTFNQYLNGENEINLKQLYTLIYNSANENWYVNNSVVNNYKHYNLYPFYNVRMGLNPIQNVNVNGSIYGYTYQWIYNLLRYDVKHNESTNNIYPFVESMVDNNSWAAQSVNTNSFNSVTNPSSGIINNSAFILTPNYGLANVSNNMIGNGIYDYDANTTKMLGTNSEFPSPYVGDENAPSHSTLNNKTNWLKRSTINPNTNWSDLQFVNPSANGNHIFLYYLLSALENSNTAFQQGKPLTINTNEMWGGDNSQLLSNYINSYAGANDGSAVPYVYSVVSSLNNVLANYSSINNVWYNLFNNIWNTNAHKTTTSAIALLQVSANGIKNNWLNSQPSNYLDWYLYQTNLNGKLVYQIAIAPATYSADNSSAIAQCYNNAVSQMIDDNGSTVSSFNANA